MGLSSAADVECQSIMRFLKQEEMETLVATSEENSATIQSISKTIAAQNNSVKDILTEIDEIAGWDYWLRDSARVMSYGWKESFQ